jgi:hypothetical protein
VSRFLASRSSRVIEHSTSNPVINGPKLATSLHQAEKKNKVP